MSQKKLVSFRVDPVLIARMQEASKAYFGKTGAVFGAALLLWLEADPVQQGEALKRLYAAEINDEVEQTIAAAKAEQVRKIQAREGREKRKPGH